MKKIVFFFAWALTLKSFSYPVIDQWQNKPQIIFENKKDFILKQKEELKSPFFVVTSEKDILQLKINSQNELFIYPNSQIQINEVFEQDDVPTAIYGLAGSFRLKHFLKTKNEKPIQNRLKTVFFDLVQAPESDVLIEINTKEPSVEIKMIHGSWDLAFFDYEKKISIKAGEQVKFVGVLDSAPGQIKYDYLLEGKKIPKGKLQDIQKFDVAAFEAQEKKQLAEKIKKDSLEKKIVQEKLRQKKKYEDSFLCKKPFAQVNQCAWRLEAEKCYRQRCNVSGEWGDKTERPITDQCTKDYLIGKCDY